MCEIKTAWGRSVNFQSIKLVDKENYSKHAIQKKKNLKEKKLFLNNKNSIYNITPKTCKGLSGSMWKDGIFSAHGKKRLVWGSR